MKVFAFGRIDPGQGGISKSRREFSAAIMRLGGDLNDRRSDVKTVPGPEVVLAEVEIDVKLIAGKGPAFLRTGDEIGGPRVHQGELRIEFRRSRSWRDGKMVDPTIPFRARGQIEVTPLQCLSLFRLGTHDDRLKPALLAWRLADVFEPGDELVCRPMHVFIVATRARTAIGAALGRLRRV